MPKNFSWEQKLESHDERLKTQRGVESIRKRMGQKEVHRATRS